MDRGVIAGLALTAVGLAAGVIAAQFAMLQQTHEHYREVQAAVSHELREHAVWKVSMEGQIDELKRIACTYPEYVGHAECP